MKHEKDKHIGNRIHEIVHAFLHESGLSSNSEWAMNEEIADWIALQLPKIISICNELNITA